ncbi:hypothetical protein D3C85_1362290 [compost metagenome]
MGRERSSGVRTSRPVPSNGKIQQKEGRLLEFLRISGSVLNIKLIKLVAVHKPPDIFGVPLNAIHMILGEVQISGYLPVIGLAVRIPVHGPIDKSIVVHTLHNIRFPAFGPAHARDIYIRSKHPKSRP